MEKRKIKITGFYQPYPRDSSCLIVFKEVRGNRKLIIRVGLYETDSILMALENIKPQRPLVHDLFYNLASAANMKMKEVIIYKYKEGIFYSKIVFIQKNHEIETPARTCDAIALALRFKSPVFVSEDILARVGTMEKSLAQTPLKELSAPPPANTPANDIATMDLDSLKTLLKEALDNENYELAGIIRDEMVKRNNPA